MTNWTRNLDNPSASASPRRGFTKDTAEACRERASADLLRSVAMINANQRLALERSAEIWMVRAQMLARVEGMAPIRTTPSAVPKEIDHVRL